MITAIRLERDTRVLSIVVRARGLKHLCCSFHDEVLGYKYPDESNGKHCKENLTNNERSR